MHHIERTALYEPHQAEELKAALFLAHILAGAGSDLTTTTQELQFGCHTTVDKSDDTAIYENQSTSLPP